MSVAEVTVTRLLGLWRLMCPAYSAHRLTKTSTTVSLIINMGGKWKKHKAAAAAMAATPAAAPMETSVPESNGQRLQHQQAPKQQHPAQHVVAKDTVNPVKAPVQQQSSQHATLSIAVPGSAIEAAPNAEAAAAIAAQIARAAAIYRASEVIVYDDSPSTTSTPSTTVTLATATLARLLQFIETPAYLRSALFPTAAAYPELRAAESLCPTLNTPHHLRGQDWKPYREGIVMRSEPGMGSFLDIGYDRNAHVQSELPVGRRITLHVGDQPRVAFVQAFSETMLQAEVASPTDPCSTHDMYWGYNVRIAHSLSRVLKEGPYKAYDLTIGTSQEGIEREAAELVLPKHKHALVVFGGSQGLEVIAQADEALVQSGKSVSDLFSMYLNCCPHQGTTSISTPDAVTLCLAYLHASLLKYGAR